ncbi:hypothetical protein MHYP_G00347220 [Metynnis hypsauchen]
MVKVWVRVSVCEVGDGFLLSISSESAPPEGRGQTVFINTDQRLGLSLTGQALQVREELENKTRVEIKTYEKNLENSSLKK